MARMIGDAVAGETTESVADERGIGCGLERIQFGLAGGKTYICETEYRRAQTILDRHKDLWPAIVFVPCALSKDLLYAQCTFKYYTSHDCNYKEAAGKNRFLRKGSLIAFMREYNVATILTDDPELAAMFHALNEPRIEESLFLAIGNSARKFRPAKPNFVLGQSAPISVSHKSKSRKMGWLKRLYHEIFR